MATRFISRAIGRCGLFLAAMLPVVAMALPAAPQAEDWTEQSVFDAQGLGGDQFGTVVAISGTVALVAASEATVGDNSAQGKVLVCAQAGDGSWSPVQTLVASDGAAFNEFGRSVAVSGHTAVIGATNAKIGSNISQGAAYVFTQGADGVWSQTQKLVADDGRPVDWFGSAVTVADDMIVVAAYGAHYDDQLGRGSVYVFTKTADTWTQAQQLVADDGEAGDYFGSAIARSGANLLVSAPGKNVGDHYAQGAVYRFALSGGSWSQAQRIVIADGAENDQLGSALAIEGDTALIGAMWRQGGQGVVYVLDGSNGDWSPAQTLAASDGATVGVAGIGMPSTDNFGMMLALQDGAALVGASNVTIDGNAGQGAAFLFRKSGGAFAGAHTFTRYDGIVSPYFGAAVALDGDNVLAGAFGYTPDWDHYQQGAAYFYRRVATGIPPSERAALIDLYDSTNGDSWWDMDGWLGVPGTECSWSGVTCDDSGTTVVGLSFDYTNMVGTLPASLSQLTNLTSLQIADQPELTGDFPSLAGMTQLQSIDVRNTAIGGPLPSLAGLTNVQFAIFLGNQFEGPIPPFGDLPSLNWFQASSNRLTGHLPSLAGLTSLSGFFVDDNQLSGTPPMPPASLGEYGASLCPNAFDHVESPAWDTITGIVPWYRDCTAAPDSVFYDGFDGALEP